MYPIIFSIKLIMLKVFVYGTLKPQEANYQDYCQGKTIAEKKCWTRGKLFALSLGYPGMTYGEDKVYGYLLTFASESELIHLDSLEGYTGVKDSPENRYDRSMVKVYDQDNSPFDRAWAYFMTERTIKDANGIYLPSGNWTDNQN